MTIDVRHVSNEKKSRLNTKLNLEFKADLFKKVANFAIFHRNNWKFYKIFYKYRVNYYIKQLIFETKKTVTLLYIDKIYSNLMYNSENLSLISLKLINMKLKSYILFRNSFFYFKKKK